MTVTKCDHCGKIYESRLAKDYVGIRLADKNNITYAHSFYLNVNQHKQITKGNNDKIDKHFHKTYDLCDDCFKCLLEYLGEKTEVEIEADYEGE